MEIRPFRGWHYRAGADGDVSPYLAPPYDVLSAEDKRQLLVGSEKNVVAVDLPHVPPGSAGADELYRAAAEQLEQWKAAGVLVQEHSPAVYVYEQSFTWAARACRRRALICGVRGCDGGRDVKLHEHTFAGPKADRLKLMQHTRTQLSPIFGFYHEPSGVVAGVLAQTAGRRPDLQGVLGGVTERVWIVTDERTIARVASALRGQPVFIADGHHRYLSALTYRDALAARGRLDGGHEANFVMFALVEAGDPGLLILPTHRIVRGLRKDFSLDKLAARAGEFAWQRASAAGADLTDADSFLRPYGPTAMAFLGAGAAEVWIARLTDARAMAAAAPDQPDAWRRLDVAILHKLIIDKALAPWRTAEFAIEYTPDSAAVPAACAGGRAQLAICLQGTPLSAVEEIALAGASMPHKSTYFHPKPATGLVLKPLE